MPNFFHDSEGSDSTTFLFPAQFPHHSKLSPPHKSSLRWLWKTPEIKTEVASIHHQWPSCQSVGLWDPFLTYVCWYSSSPKTCRPTNTSTVFNVCHCVLLCSVCFSALIVHGSLPISIIAQHKAELDSAPSKERKQSPGWGSPSEGMISCDPWCLMILNRHHGLICCVLLPNNFCKPALGHMNIIPCSVCFPGCRICYSLLVPNHTAIPSIFWRILEVFSRWKWSWGLSTFWFRAFIVCLHNFIGFFCNLNRILYIFVSFPPSHFCVFLGEDCGSV